MSQELFLQKLNDDIFTIVDNDKVNITNYLEQEIKKIKNELKNLKSSDLQFILQTINNLKK